MNKNRLIRQTMTMLLAFAMVFTMMPLLTVQNSYAASAPGGTITADTTAAAKESAKAAFGLGDSNVTTSGNTLSIKLASDVELEQPVRFVPGSASKRVVLDLNGHTITGKAGSDRSAVWEAACGGNAIEIVASYYDVEIKGTGSVVGGKGATYVSGGGLRYGADGGAAVCFVAPESGGTWYPWSDDNPLDYGLKITGEAQLTGGTGGDMSGDDWLNNIPQTSGNVGNNYQFRLEAGKGGAGIGQTNAGIEYRADNLTYARIEVESGTVKGGSGGTVNLGTDNMPFMTHYGFMNNSVIDTYMKSLYKQDTTYDEYLANEIVFLPGDGGNGITIGAGRKYLSVDNGATIIGGACGAMEYGKSKWINNINNYDNQVPTSGAGIGVYGDIGYKNVEASLTDGNKGSKGKTSDDMGIYIAGRVEGGTPPTAKAKGDNAGNAGDGIVLNGEDSYAMYKDSNNEKHTLNFPGNEDAAKWGIVEVAAGGQVLGGSGAVAQNGISSKGGIGIHEAYTKSNDGRSGESKIGTDYYLINGTVQGGKGGDSMSGLAAGGGSGFSFGNGRKDARIYGGGGAIGGNGGVYIDRDGASSQGSVAEGVRFYVREYNNNESHITETAGQKSQARQINNSGLSVSASMSSFKDYPSTATQLSCTVSKPSGYIGNVYITWFAEIKLQTNDSEVCVLEPPENNNTKFNLLSNEQYKYLAYKTYPDNPSSDSVSYNIDNIATADRITYTLKSKSSYAKIYCEVQLEDGRWAKSNVMTVSTNDRFETSGWNGGGSTDPGSDPEADDVAAATEVADMINKLPATITLDNKEAVYAAWEAYSALNDNAKSKVWPDQVQKLTAAKDEIDRLQVEADTAAADEVAAMITALGDNITLDKEADVIAARSAYDALTDAQKEKVADSVLNKLTAAEGTINGLNQDAADDMTALISQLPDDLSLLESEDPADNDAKDALKAQIESVAEAYSNLSDRQKALIDDDIKKVLSTAVEEYNDAFPENTIEDPTRGIEITADMVTVADATYTGDELNPEVTVTNEGTVLTDGTDYTLVYADNINAGTGKVTVTGIGNYEGEVTKNFTINKASINGAAVSGIANKTYNRSAQTQNPEVKVNGRTLKNGTDYTLSYKNNTNAGTATVTITAKGNYTGSVSRNFSIARRSITPTVALSKSAFTWNNKVQTPKVTVKDGGVVLPANQYTVSYPKGRKNIGAYSIKVTLKGNYAGARTVTYNIVPKGSRLTGAKAEKKKGTVTVRWAKQTAKMPKARINGYQIQYSMRKDFKSGNKAVNVGGYNKNSRRISGLKSKKTYYFRVRTYMKAGRKTYYSGWSNVRSTKVK